jgi:hypothetical protein
VDDDREKRRGRIWPPDTWWYPADRTSLPYVSAGAGYGLLAIGLGILVAGGSLILSATAALIGAGLLTYGLRNY